MEIPALAHDAYRRGAGSYECRQGWVDIDFAGRPACRTERYEFGICEFEFKRGALKELLVFWIGLGVAPFDPMHTKPVELLGNTKLVFNCE